MKFRRLGTMIDCSRNAVMKPDAVKKWIDITANILSLYLEELEELVLDYEGDTSATDRRAATMTRA